MIRAALAFFLGVSLAAVPAGAGAPVGTMDRTAPARPAALPPLLPTTRIDGIEYVSATDMALRLGLKGSWADEGRKLTLADQAGKMELEAASREVMVNGLRLFIGNPVVARQGRFFVSRTDFERCLAPLLRHAPGGLVPARPRVIALDPGHGGGDPGMENKVLGLQEKVLTLDVALRLEKLLKAEGYAVVLTRRDDRQLGPDKATDWRRRGEIANEAGADLLISIHFNSLYPDTRTSGTEVYTFTRAGQRSDRSWSVGEKDDTETKPMEVNRFDPWSSLLAQSLHGAVMAKLGTLDRGQKTMHSGVLRGLKCPGVLVEAVFLSKDSEARRAATPEFRGQIAEGLADGIRAYVAALDALRPRASPAPSVTPGSPPPSITR